MKEFFKKTNFKELIKNSIPIIIFVVIMCVLTLIFWPYIIKLDPREPENAELLLKFREWIVDTGFWGWLVTLGIQLLQIFVAFIPGEPIEIMLGYVWGPIWGTLTCLLGIFIGTSIIFLIVRTLGVKFVKKVVGDKDLTTYKFLSDKKKLDLTICILFLIPGTPKDALTYIVPLAPISPVKYLLISTFARIPSIITSTILGGSLAENNWVLAIIVFIITAVISLAGLIFGYKFVEDKSKKHEKKEKIATKK